MANRQDKKYKNWWEYHGGQAAEDLFEKKQAWRTQWRGKTDPLAPYDHTPNYDASNSQSARVTGKAAKKLGPLFGLSIGLDTIANMRQGDSFGTAATKGLVSGMLWETMPAIMTAQMLATAVPNAIATGASWYRQRKQWYNNQHLPNFGGNYRDTQRALTMRQAGIQAIQGSKLNARSALGGEAQILAQSMYRGVTN